MKLKEKFLGPLNWDLDLDLGQGFEEESDAKDPNGREASLEPSGGGGLGTHEGSGISGSGSPAPGGKEGRAGGLFMNKYTREKLRRALEAHGIWDFVQGRGFRELDIRFDFPDPFLHRALLYGHKDSAEHLLVDLNIRRITFVSQLRSNLRETLPTVSQTGYHGGSDHENSPGVPFAAGQTLLIDFLTALSNDATHPLDLAVIEWLRMQDPTTSFSRPPLPGQEHPGLGCGKAFHGLIRDLASKSNRDAVGNSPAYFHNALLYHHLGYAFGNPQLEGTFRLLLRDLESEINSRGLATVSFAFLCGKIKTCKTNESVLWVPGEQFEPLSARFRSYMWENKDYLALLNQILKAGEPGPVFYIDWEAELGEEQLALATPFRRLHHIFQS